jgi:hypothetical protein
MIFNFDITKKITFQKLFVTHHKSARDPSMGRGLPVWETLVCKIHSSILILMGNRPGVLIRKAEEEEEVQVVANTTI